MKLFYPLIIPFLLITSNLSAQTFAPEGSRWTFCVSNFFGHWGGNFDVEILETYFVEDKLVKIIGNQQHHFPQRHFYTVGDSTFVYHPQSGISQLLMNFSMNKGDTILFNRYNSGGLYLEWINFNQDLTQDDYLIFVVDSTSIIETEIGDLRWYSVVLEGLSQSLQYPDDYPEYYIESHKMQNKMEFLEKVGMINVSQYRGDFIFLPVFILDGFYSIQDLNSTDFKRYHLNSLENVFTMPPFCNWNLDVEEISETSFSIHPNPTSDFINISNLSNQSAVVTLLDVNGKVLLSQNIFSENPQINISHLPKGIYILQVIQDKQVQNFKIVKH